MSVTARERRLLLRHPAGLVACGFGSGLSPVAPGTAGSIAALLPWLALHALPFWIYAAAVVLAFALGVWVCSWAVHALGAGDPGVVVWDEFVGLWIALAPLVLVQRNLWWVVAGFILFRIFDIAKPWPVSWADEQVHGGFGVMLDDVLAGIYAAVLLAALLYFLH